MHAIGSGNNGSPRLRPVDLGKTPWYLHSWALMGPQGLEHRALLLGIHPGKGTAQPARCATTQSRTDLTSKDFPEAKPKRKSASCLQHRMGTESWNLLGGKGP